METNAVSLTDNFSPVQIGLQSKGALEGKNQNARGHDNHGSDVANHIWESEKQKHIQQDSKNFVIDGMLSTQGSLCQKLEEQHVSCVYDQIATHFSSTRYAPWPKVADFLKGLDEGSLVYDIGCGNGKYAQVNPSVVMIGADASIPLLTFCRKKGMPAVGAEAKRLPFRSNSGDHVICIAMLHHLASQENRLTSLKELIRVLKPKGTALVTVWAFEQSKDGSDSKYIRGTKVGSSTKSAINNRDLTQAKTEHLKQDKTSLEEPSEAETKENFDRRRDVEADDTSQNFPQSNDKEVEESQGNLLLNNMVSSNCSTTNNEYSSNTCLSSSNSGLGIKSLPIHKNRKAFEAQDVLVPWNDRNSGKTLLRFYHVFVENELSCLCQQISGVTIIQEVYDQGNWCLIFRKDEKDKNSPDLDSTDRSDTT
jgi:alkylated DNA repair protein alkB family protein 8